MRALAYKILKNSIIKRQTKRKSPFVAIDIVQQGHDKLVSGIIKQFNNQVIDGDWEDEEDLADITLEPISTLNNYITMDDE